MTRSIYSARYRRVCEVLVRAREMAGLTQAELAQRLGRPQSFVSKVETAERRIDAVEFIEIADAIGTDPHRLLRQIIS